MQSMEGGLDYGPVREGIALHELKKEDGGQLLDGREEEIVANAGRSDQKEEHSQIEERRDPTSITDCNDSVKVDRGSPVVHLQEPTPVKASSSSFGLRRSMSDAASSSLDADAADADAESADEVEVAQSPNKKHRFSLASAIKTTTSPIMRRRQTVFDAKIHTLLQEGKEFINRKRQHVPLLAALGGKIDRPATPPAPSASQNDQHQPPITDQQRKELQQQQPFGKSGSIIYRRKYDSVMLDNTAEDPAETETTTTATATSNETNEPPANSSSAFSSPSKNQKADATTTTGSPSRPTDLPANQDAAFADQQQSARNGGSPPGDGDSSQQQQHEIGPNSSSAPKSLFWKYHKMIIGSILCALTIAEFSSGFRSVPVFILGLLWGWYLAYIAVAFICQFLLPPERYKESVFAPAAMADSPLINDDDVFADVTAAEKQIVVVEDTIVYKGWINRLTSKYDPRKYHVNSARSVLVRLDRNILRLSTPKTNLSRHVYCRDPRVDPTFVSQEIFDIRGANVVLRPRRLARRRWWSRKYPITILLPRKNVGRGGSACSVSMAENIQSSAEPDEKQANDDDATTKVDCGESSKDGNPEAAASEVGVDALAADEEDGRRRLENGGFAESDEDRESDDEDDAEEEYDSRVSAASLHSTSSVPSNLGQINGGGGSAIKKIRRRTSRRIIYLFARSNREKEHWFYQLREAACRYSYLDRQKRLRKRLTRSASDAETPTAADSKKSDRSSELAKKEEPLSAEWILYTSLRKQYERHMRSFMAENRPKVDVQLMDLASMMWKTDTVLAKDASTPSAAPAPGMMSTDWVNAFGSRLFYDFSRNPHWIGKVRDRIQSKLATVRLPYFIETLTLKQLAPGTTAPRITAVSDPTMNEWGLWIDTKLEYLGGLRLVLETKLNLMKLKTEAGPRDASRGRNLTKLTNYEDEEIPESPESSPDEDGQSNTAVAFHHHSGSYKAGGSGAQDSPRESTGKKFLNFVDKIAQSKYFQEATENKYLKKLMQGVSDTPLVLEVEVMFISGAMAINIPPPPSDRLWYGFRFPPKIILKALPRVGERVVNLTHVTDWIENKMVILLEKNLVVPNMDDLIIPIMSGSPLVKNFNL